VLWFDESYAEHEAYRMEDVLKTSETFETVVFVGTSFSVGVTAMLLENIVVRGQAFSVDPNARSPHRSVEVIQEPAEKLLPALAASLLE
jgi:NAD-dependent deacetylase